MSALYRLMYIGNVIFAFLGVVCLLRMWGLV